MALQKDLKIDIGMGKPWGRDKRYERLLGDINGKPKLWLRIQNLKEDL